MKKIIQSILCFLGMHNDLDLATSAEGSTAYIKCRDCKKWNDTYNRRWIKKCPDRGFNYRLLTNKNMSIYEQFKQALFKESPELYKKVVCISEQELEEISMDAGYFDHKKYLKEKPITLEDVLRALEQVNTGTTDNYCSFMDGTIVQIGNKEDICKWILGKPASEQEEATLLALIKLLE
jgi:hypothetical protein